MKKVIAYIDGYNFYHSTKNKPSANINLQSLCSSMLITGQELIRVHYFSAYATWRRTDHLKHRQYVSKLKMSGVQITMSHFKSKEKVCFKCGAVTKTHEEKETDVRITLQILEDAIDNKFDTAFILSGDSDIVPAIEKVRERYTDKRILVVLPKHQVKYARDMKNVTHGLINLSPSRIRKHLF